MVYGLHSPSGRHTWYVRIQLSHEKYSTYSLTPRRLLSAKLKDEDNSLVRYYLQRRATGWKSISFRLPSEQKPPEWCGDPTLPTLFKRVTKIQRLQELSVTYLTFFTLWRRELFWKEVHVFIIFAFMKSSAYSFSTTRRKTLLVPCISSLCSWFWNIQYHDSHKNLFCILEYELLECETGKMKKIYPTCFHVN